MRLFCCTLTLLLCTLTAGNALAEHRLGGGVNYWVMLKDLDDKDFDNKGLSANAPSTLTVRAEVSKSVP